jgi:predicted signal transduction protein with EAL and GGDEF domain
VATHTAIPEGARSGRKHRTLRRVRLVGLTLVAAEVGALLIQQFTHRNALPTTVDVLLVAVGMAAMTAGLASEVAGRRAFSAASEDNAELTDRRRRDNEAVVRTQRRRQRVQDVLDCPSGLWMVYQPIVSLRDGQVVGYEALSRFDDGRPEDWYHEAAEVGLGTQLELKAVRTVLDDLPSLPGQLTYVAINCSPATLLSDELVDLLACFPRGRVVVELTENVRIDDYERARREVDRLRLLGVRIAVDDVGSGAPTWSRSTSP